MQCTGCSRYRRNIKSYQNSLAVVDLVLDDLRHPAGEGFEPCLELLVLPLHLNGLETLRAPRTGEGQAALLGLIHPRMFDDDGIEHDHVFALVVKGDDNQYRQERDEILMSINSVMKKKVYK